MSSELARRDATLGVDEMKSMAEIFVAAKVFQVKKSDTYGGQAPPEKEQMARAFVCIQAGQEYGIQPFQSMNSFDIIQGTIAMKPMVMLSKVKASDKYDYEVVEQSAQRACIRFYEKSKRTGEWVVSGEQEFTMAMAIQMQLASKNEWKKQPATMLFWRCASFGVKRYCPDVLDAVIYDSLEVHDFTNEESPIDIPEMPAATVVATSAPKAPASPATVKTAVETVKNLPEMPHPMEGQEPAKKSAAKPRTAKKVEAAPPVVNPEIESPEEESIADYTSIDTPPDMVQPTEETDRLPEVEKILKEKFKAKKLVNSDIIKRLWMIAKNNYGIGADRWAQSLSRCGVSKSDLLEERSLSTFISELFKGYTLSDEQRDELLMLIPVE